MRHFSFTFFGVLFSTTDSSSGAVGQDCYKSADVFLPKKKKVLGLASSSDTRNPPSLGIQPCRHHPHLFRCHSKPEDGGAVGPPRPETLVYKKIMQLFVVSKTGGAIPRASQPVRTIRQYTNKYATVLLELIIRRQDVHR